MKKILLILLQISFVCLYAQTSTVNPVNSCGSKIPPNYVQWRNSVVSTQNLVSTLKHDLCVNKKFSIVFYVIADSTGAMGGVTQAGLDSCVELLNKTFGRICVSFLSCSTVVIPNHPFNRWTRDTIEPVVVKNWHTDKTINIYVPKEILGPFAGYAYFPGGKDVIVIEKSSINSSTSVHEMGHFFGLTHTFNEISSTSTTTPSAELVARTNCYTNGDGFCDTEADCYPQNFSAAAPCGNVPGAKDANNQYYVVPVDNFMTYFTCGCKFTQEQYNFMANVILTSRLYLH